MIPRKRILVAFGAALFLAGSAATAMPTRPKTYPAGAFAVAGHRLSPSDILDARALPDMQGKPSLMVTLAPAAAAAIAAGAGGTLACTLDGKPLGDSSVDALKAVHVLAISGDFGDYEAAAALARRISGRDPLPDSESDE